MCFYGALTPQHVCFHEELIAWPDWGIETFLTVTDPSGQPWQSHVGFVQQNVGRISPSPKETVAMLVGMPEMIQANTELLRRLGFLPDAILLNY
jgi:NAD(P)H-flavin reductase